MKKLKGVSMKIKGKNLLHIYTQKDGMIVTDWQDGFYDLVKSMRSRLKLAINEAILLREKSGN